MALLLPVVLYPLYMSGDGLTVMGVPQVSPLSGYLSVHDVILSVDGLNIRRTDDWMKMLDQGTIEKISSREFLGGSQSYGATISGKGYCVPNSWLDASKNLWQINDKLACPDELTVFGKFSCNGSVTFSETDRGSDKKEAESKYCLIAKDVVKLKKCGNGWRGTKDDESNCTCLEDEYCLVPVLPPGFSWIEISYARPYSLEFLVSSPRFLRRNPGRRQLDDSGQPEGARPRARGGAEAQLQERRGRSNPGTAPREGQEGARGEERQEGGTGFWELRRVLHGHQE